MAILTMGQRKRKVAQLRSKHKKFLAEERKKRAARTTRTATLSAAEKALFREVKSLKRGRPIKPETLRRLKEKAAKLSREHKAQRVKDTKVARDLRGIEKTLSSIEKGLRKERRALGHARREVKKNPGKY